MRAAVQNPKVSVCVIAYNQEDYINQCLESILAQQTNFDYDIVVGEDCSNDNTANIIESLSDVHKNILLLDNNVNLGVLPNFIRTINACKGKYIAFCEGDDYWIDECKLQKQVDFLDAHDKYGGVSTNNRWYFEKENTYKDSMLEEEEITFERLCQTNYINSQTILIRKELIKSIDWMNELKIGDWAMHLLVTSQKPYYRLQDVTTVYRVHEGGVHSLLNEEFKTRHKIDVLIAVFQNLDLTNERREILKSSIKNILKQLISYPIEDVKTIRKKYFEFGGKLFNKTLLKSYINDIF